MLGYEHLHEPAVKDLSPSALNSEPSLGHACSQCSRNENVGPVGMNDLWE